MNIILLFIAFQSTIFSIENESLQNESLVKYALILPDFAQNITFQQALTLNNSFKPYAEWDNIIDTDKKSYWIKIELENSAQNEEFVLTTAPWDRVVVYQNSDNTWESYEDGFLTPFNDRKVKFGRLMNIPLELEKGKTHTIYIHFSSLTSRGVSSANTYNFLKIIDLSNRIL